MCFTGLTVHTVYLSSLPATGVEATDFAAANLKLGQHGLSGTNGVPQTCPEELKAQVHDPKRPSTQL